MKVVSVRAIVVVLFMSTGCAGLTSQQQRALTGGAIGAAGGAVFGAITRGSAAVGAVIGGAAGAAGGVLLDELNQTGNNRKAVASD